MWLQQGPILTTKIPSRPQYHPCVYATRLLPDQPGVSLAAAATHELQAAGNRVHCSFVVKAVGVRIELPRALWHWNGMGIPL